MKGVFIVIMALGMLTCSAQNKDTVKAVVQDNGNKIEETMDSNTEKSEEQWKKELTPEQYYVLREKGTERPFTGEYNMHFEDGIYHCAACDAALFESDSKFNSHCGWPSFDKPISKSAVVEILDKSHGMIRTEITCGNCGGHLGHVFNDGPTETGVRYCINSVSLDFDTPDDGTTEKTDSTTQKP